LDFAVAVTEVINIQIATKDQIRGRRMEPIIRDILGGLHLGGVCRGGVLSPLLWSLVVDDLLWGLDDGYYTVGYADDIAILIHGKFLMTVSECLQTALHTVQRWCERTGFSINPDKMVIIQFTRRKNMKDLKEPVLFNNTIQLSSDVKYLGLTLDKGLTWRKELDKVINRAYQSINQSINQNAFWTCRGMFGKTWGLQPHVVHWIYTAGVRPIITYGATVWWPRVRLKTSQAELSKLQRLACLLACNENISNSCTGDTSWTPSTASMAGGRGQGGNLPSPVQ
jgi:hypothetical protein